MMIWLACLTMEETFILTGASIVLTGTALGLLFGWIETKKEKNRKQGADK